MGHVIVRYYSARMLLTVDLNTLTSALFDAYGEDVTIEFVAMSEAQRTESTQNSQLVHLVQDRFQIFELRAATNRLRRPDIEQKAIQLGRK
jgi:hypothetical protein